MRNLLILLLVFVSFGLFAQKIENTQVIHKEGLSIKTNGLTRGYSLLDIGLTGDSVGGLRMSPMTQAQIDALSPSSADSTLIVYNGTDSTYQYWDGNSWEGFGGGGDNIYTADGSLPENRTVTMSGNSLTFSGGKAVFSGTDNGIKINEVTTAQMNAISTPSNNELVFNTDLEGLYRYDGTNWVALSAGYGIVGVTTDTDAGIPTYYADLQSALNECKTSGSNNNITLYSSIETTSELTINAADGFDYQTLTIDLNGYEIFNNSANSDDLLQVAFPSSTQNSKTTLINGYLTRNNSTGGYVLNFNNVNGGVHISNCVVYNSGTGGAGYFNMNTPVISSANQSNSINNLGGSIFLAESGNGIDLVDGRFRNFVGISKTSGRGCIITCEFASDFYGYSQTNNGVRITGGGYACAFTGESDSGSGVLLTNGDISDFYSYSNSGLSFYVIGGVASNFYTFCESNYALYANGTCEVVNGTAKANSSTYTSWFNSGAKAVGMKSINLTGGYAGYIKSNSIIEHCSFTSNSGISALIEDDVDISLSVFSSEWNNSGGHSVSFTGIINPVYLSLCKFSVVNASANCLYSASASTVSVGNSAFKGATTPINANVTVSLTSAPDANGNYTN